MRTKQLKCPRPDAWELRLIRVCKLASDPCGSDRMAVASFALIRFRYELLQQRNIAGVMELHELCAVFQLCGSDAREPFHIHGMLRLVLQKRNEEPLAFKVVCLPDAVYGAVGDAQPPVPNLSKVR